MRSVARLIARTLPADALDAMRRITGGREFAILDADTDPILDPVLPMIARALPVGVVCQIVRVADRTGCDCCEVTAEVVTAARQEAPRGAAARQARSACLRWPVLPLPYHLWVSCTAPASAPRSPLVSGLTT